MNGASRAAGSMLIDPPYRTGGECQLAAGSRIDDGIVMVWPTNEFVNGPFG